MKILSLFLVIFSLVLISGCRTVMVVPTPVQATVVVGHPPHAPAHGYRYHHPQGVDLVFDSDLGAYLVVGYEGLYFYDGFYLRFYNGYWQKTDRYDGRWHRAENRRIPRGLWRNKRYARELRHAPPPHAPAHGYRHHYYDVDMVFDSGIGAYIVLGFDDLFFLDGLYLRFYDGRWHSSDRYDGRWRLTDDRHIPRKLRHARSQKKQGLFKQIKQQYREQHQEEREYRKKHHQHQDRNSRHEKHQYDRDYRDRDRDKDRDRDRSSRKEHMEINSKDGLYGKVKKKHEDKKTRKNDRDEESNRDGENDNGRHDDRREQHDNGYRR